MVSHYLGRSASASWPLYSKSGPPVMITEKASHFQVACSPCPPKHISDYQSSSQAEQGLSPEGIGRTQLIPSSITHASEGGSSAPPPWPLDPDLWNQLLYPEKSLWFLSLGLIICQSNAALREWGCSIKVAMLIGTFRVCVVQWRRVWPSSHLDCGQCA